MKTHSHYLVYFFGKIVIIAWKADVRNTVKRWFMKKQKGKLHGKKREFLLRLAALFCGLVIAHLGVTLFILSDLGADPFNVLIQGLRNLISPALPQVSHGMVHMAVSFLIILVLLIADRTYVRAGTLVCMFCGGPIIDFFTWALTPFGIGQANLVVKAAVLVAGCVILAFGMTVVIRSEAGTGPNDLVAVVISDKLKKRFGIVRIIVDFSFIAVGAVLGGVFGPGTLICAFLVGPVADFFMPLSGRIVDRILRI